MAVDWQKKMSVNLNLISLVNLKKIYTCVCIKLLQTDLMQFLQKKKPKPFRFLRKKQHLDQSE